MRIGLTTSTSETWTPTVETFWTSHLTICSTWALSLILSTAETHPDDAYLTNAIGPENAVYIANELDIPVLYIGTAGIFDGQQIVPVDSRA